MSLRRPDPERLLLYAVMPTWGLAGLADWWCHRRTEIERPENGGFRESLVHVVMLAEAAVPIGLVMTCEVDLGVLVFASAAAVMHEVTAHHDLLVAGRSKREVSALELQVHGILEALPFALVAFAGMTAAQRSWQARRFSWLLRVKRAPLPTPLLLAGIGWIGVAGIGPYLEELRRCWRTSRSGLCAAAK